MLFLNSSYNGWDAGLAERRGDAIICNEIQAGSVVYLTESTNNFIEFWKHIINFENYPHLQKWLNKCKKGEEDRNEGKTAPGALIVTLYIVQSTIPSTYRVLHTSSMC